MAVSLDQSNMVQGASTQYGWCQTQIGSFTKLTKKQNRKSPIFSSPPTTTQRSTKPVKIHLIYFVDMKNFFGDDVVSRRDLTMSSRNQSLVSNKDRSSCSLMRGLQYHNPELGVAVTSCSHFVWIDFAYALVALPSK